MDQEALARLATAEFYTEAVRVLVSEQRKGQARSVMLDLPINMLAGFALELSFKGYLLLKGYGSLATRSLGHDIKGLAAQATARGFPAINLLTDLIDTLGEGHADFTYRYIDNGQETDVFAWDLVLPIFDDISAAIKTELKKQAGIP